MRDGNHYIYHITHIDNLRSIIKQGKLFSKKTIGNDYVNIAHQSVQQKRVKKEVPLSPFGCLHDYVPFYFGMRSPMLYAIQKNTVDDYKDGQESIIYLVSSVEWCNNDHLQFVFTDGHAAVELSTFFNDVKDLVNVNFEAAKTREWFDDHEHMDRKRQKQSEFLVKEKFPWEGVLGIVTISEETKHSIGAIYEALKPLHKPKIVVEPNWYY